MKTAIYPLSADPITNGHLDIIYRATKIFDEVIVAIGNNFSKKYLFDIKDRENITRKVLKSYSFSKNLEILSFDCLLTDLAYQKRINFIVRGFRNSNDYLHELNLYQNYLSQNSNLEFINLFSSKEFISSTAVKEIANLNGEIHTQVPILVKQNLEKKLHKQKFIAVTGEFGSGKSTLIQKIIKQNPDKKIDWIDFDKLGHLILKNPNLKEEIIQKLDLKWNLKEFLEKSSKSSNQKKTEQKQEYLETFFRQKLAAEVFTDLTNLKKLTSHLLPLILIEFRKQVKQKSGLILLEIPLLAEQNLEYLASNQIILVKNDSNNRIQNLKKIGYTDLEIEQRLNSQLKYEKKRFEIQKQIKTDNFGKLVEINLTDLENLEDNLQNLLRQFEEF